MNTMLKEATRMENTKKTYLEMYKEFINGYLQYKLGKADGQTPTHPAESHEK
ncbi:hypothetical protein QWY22_10380 [Planococcus liqunii]|uniref:Integrase n=1 Tax=Planococcus liqunii TaxID=3058394 RepID=A0ABT8MTB1_9BACL|nr:MULTISPECIES: hypothetical protein [unclassified Planococcus (in: firmicutes)]MDN7228142.1 hypothetical protein [Planococcus sp. N064]WKA49315.1 hypothetical protein QWY22_10380 [Planococcus sp. N056]